MATLSGSWLQSLLRVPETPHQVGQRAGDQEILLHETQALALAGRVVGIKHARDGLRQERLGHGADEVAVAEGLEIEEVRRGRLPQSERVDGLAAVADDRAVVGHADQPDLLPGTRAQPSPADLEPAVQPDSDLLVQTRALPTGPGGAASCRDVPTCQPSLMLCLKMPYS